MKSLAWLRNSLRKPVITMVNQIYAWMFLYYSVWFWIVFLFDIFVFALNIYILSYMMRITKLILSYKMFSPGWCDALLGNIKSSVCLESFIWILQFFSNLLWPPKPSPLLIFNKIIVFFYTIISWQPMCSHRQRRAPAHWRNQGHLLAMCSPAQCIHFYYNEPY